MLRRTKIPLKGDSKQIATFSDLVIKKKSLVNGSNNVADILTEAIAYWRDNEEILQYEVNKIDYDSSR